MEKAVDRRQDHAALLRIWLCLRKFVVLLLSPTMIHAQAWFLGWPFVPSNGSCLREGTCIRSWVFVVSARPGPWLECSLLEDWCCSFSRWWPYTWWRRGGVECVAAVSHASRLMSASCSAQQMSTCAVVGVFLCTKRKLATGREKCGVGGASSHVWERTTESASLYGKERH